MQYVDCSPFTWKRIITSPPVISMQNQLGAGLPANMRNMQAMAGQMGDQHLHDTAEVVYISSLALLKMLKHGM
jgi:hypothetical protein